MAVEYLDVSNGYTEKVPKWTTETPVHAYEMNVRMELILSSVVALHKMIEDNKNAKGIYTGDEKPDADTFLWFSPIDYVDDDTDDDSDKTEIILEAIPYTGNAAKMHVETSNGETYTAANTAVTKDGEDTVITFSK